MLVVLFRSRHREHGDPEYERMAGEMLERARRAPGFVDFRHYTAEDGEEISVIWWRDAETLRAWREDARHRIAQRLGREAWYAWYKLEVAELLRQDEFDAAPLTPPSRERG